tara:strand:- start:343 stop:645 length:303 start_codon:yes stop_codon:yes gene_type:complete
MLAKIKKNYFLLICTFLFLYFFFNLLDGERGMISYFEKKKSLENFKEKELILINKIDNLYHKNSLLNENIDLDYIEILIRQKFLFGKTGENVYIIKKDAN